MASFSEQEIRAIVRSELRSIVGATDAGGADIEYLPTSSAYKKLGYKSSEQLRKKVKSGLFRRNIEYQDRRSSDSEYSRYYFNIPACLKRLNTPPEEREA